MRGFFNVVVGLWPRRPHGFEISPMENEARANLEVLSTQLGGPQRT